MKHETSSERFAGVFVERVKLLDMAKKTPKEFHPILEKALFLPAIIDFSKGDIKLFKKSISLARQNQKSPPKTRTRWRKLAKAN